MGRKKIQIPRQELIDSYVEKKQSLGKIAKKFSCTKDTVRTRIKEHKIPMRSPSEARMKYKKYNFSQDVIEKAYMIGFRLGDLNAYQRSKNSELIVVRCNTTRTEQIKLVKKLFSKYGRVTISPGKYSTNINCYLNCSFRFLLPKYKNVPLWIEEDARTIASFIAGYTDAEGNFLINQSRARFKIDAYDKETILWIATMLRERKIRAITRCIAKKGEFRNNNMKFNNDLWRINVNEAFSLLNFINYIKPFIKHKTRMKDIINCEENIKQRIDNGTIKNAEC